MEGHHSHYGVSVICGAIFGLTKYNVLGSPYVDTAIKAAIGGIAGFLAKELALLGYKAIKKYITNRKNKKKIT